MEIRVADTDDARYIALLARITFTETFGHLFRDKNDLLAYYDKTFSVHKIKTSIEKENNKFWIAFYNDLPVGYAKLKCNSNSDFLKQQNQSQLQKIYILQDFLSKKIGYQLQNHLLDMAKTVSNVIWLSVLDSNKRAINFYSKNGFAPIGNHDFSIGKETFQFIAMAKQLN